MSKQLQEYIKKKKECIKDLEQALKKFSQQLNFLDMYALANFDNIDDDRLLSTRLEKYGITIGINEKIGKKELRGHEFYIKILPIPENLKI